MDPADCVFLDLPRERIAAVVRLFGGAFRLVVDHKRSAAISTRWRTARYSPQAVGIVHARLE